MNSFIEAQCRNMQTMLKTFQNGCALAAKQDDGAVSPEEQAALDAINAAADRFSSELNRILSGEAGPQEQKEKKDRRKWHGLF